MSYCPLTFRMSLVLPVLSHCLTSNRMIFMKFIYSNGVMMHVKIYKDVFGCRDVMPSDCPNTNGFRAIHMNTHSDAHGYSLEQELLPKFIISAGNINSLPNLNV